MIDLTFEELETLKKLTEKQKEALEKILQYYFHVGN
jgi:hypothetical protein